MALALCSQHTIVTHFSLAPLREFSVDPVVLTIVKTHHKKHKLHLCTNRSGAPSNSED